MHTRQLHCRVIETDRGTDELGCPQRRGFAELLPWADPYIAQLLLRLQMQMAGEAVGASYDGTND